MHEVHNDYLAGPFLEDLAVWTSGVIEKFREVENSLTTEAHSLELSLSKMESEVSAKRNIFLQQQQTDERMESEQRERIDEEKERFEESMRRKEAEKKRYTDMLEEITTMHQATMASMANRQKELRAKLEMERNTVLEEQVCILCSTCICVLYEWKLRTVTVLLITLVFCSKNSVLTDRR